MKLKKILLVDDDYISNMLTEVEIRISNLAESVEIANNGEEGLSKVKESCQNPSANGCFDLILLDVNMPVMDGFEFLSEFRNLSLNHKPSVVMFTSSSNPKDIERSRQLNVPYIVKPLSAEKLLPVIQSIK